MSANSTSNIVNWAPNPDGRGTIDLLWTCFATVFLCTWSAIHLNLPELGEKESRVFRRRIITVFLCIVGPEYFAAVALSELGEAMKLKAKTPGWSLRRCFFFLMGGFVVQSSTSDAKCYRIPPKKLLSLFESKEIPWPDVPESEIRSRSRADWLSKAVSMVQILYFVTSLIGRWAQGLAVTTLELFTLGIVVCAIVIFIGYWTKPFDVQIPIVIGCNTNICAADCIGRVESTDGGEAIDSPEWSTFGGLFICLAFGALHIAAWNFHFPSHTEQLLWRISSTCSTGVLCCLVAPIVLPDAWTEKWESITFTPGVVLYFIFRAYMFVEMFVSLRAVPESVYQTPNWLQYFPFLG